MDGGIICQLRMKGTGQIISLADQNRCVGQDLYLRRVNFTHAWSADKKGLHRVGLVEINGDLFGKGVALPAVSISLDCDVEQPKAGHEDHPGASTKDGAVKISEGKLIEAPHGGRFAAGDNQSLDLA